MKKIVDLYLDRPKIFILFLLFVVVGGLLSFDSLPRQENPQLAERWGDITAVLPGASPERVAVSYTHLTLPTNREV